MLQLAAMTKKGRGDAKLYRVTGWGGEKWFSSLAEARFEVRDRITDGATGKLDIVAVALTVRLTPRHLAIALLNKDPKAFVSVEPVS